MNKCKGCEWYNKPYWSIINPCDNCPRDNAVEKIEVFSHWIDPSIEELQQRIDKAIEILSNEINKCNSAITNPEYTICCKHKLLKQEKNELIKLLEILRGNSDE